ncbi:MULTISPECIES: hypothetical protein [unclassified Rhizobium]|uniref:hypothetical protein n=1 Tax=unclassified Rhizobium TaxID=2613769 RepID=UPI00161AC5C6|nr:MULTISPECIES: hypothetical protein [unclassified Rhizobium]MBB3320224.1 hypothetical protein [Rhizobium sp. BK181]MBB3544731.1 hypothetical protein [Rhizobium sp. BK399]
MAETTDILSLLKDLSAGISNVIGYRACDDEGTRAPLQNAGLWVWKLPGSSNHLCEAVRVLGLGTRAISRYRIHINRTSELTDALPRQGRPCAHDRRTGERDAEVLKLGVPHIRVLAFEPATRSKHEV